ncbi:PREDICTED: uncharacterized protein LOC108559257, partial [Nicrophorus vespilloides]|uniref:Uncharacterized protein LOC108559257 n=1 Tax=Nicrophorus vespilloides TaxID=110193 RepID=A0ABM1MBL2_NICVS
MPIGNMFNPEDVLGDIIKLKLKKPKNWNWELTTSKSSPHLFLPVIQLYDAKGKLLVEAKDDGSTQRNSWNNGCPTQKNSRSGPQRNSSEKDVRSARPKKCKRTRSAMVVEEAYMYAPDGVKYQTRTSTAGTLIVREDGMVSGKRQRRRHSSNIKVDGNANYIVQEPEVQGNERPRRKTRRKRVDVSSSSSSSGCSIQ